MGWRLGADSQASRLLRVAASAGAPGDVPQPAPAPRWLPDALAGTQQLPERLGEAAQAALLATLSGGAATLWDDLRELVEHLRAVEAGDPDAHVRQLAVAVLDNDVTRSLVLAPLAGLGDDEDDELAA